LLDYIKPIRQICGWW